MFDYLKLLFITFALINVTVSHRSHLKHHQIDIDELKREVLNEIELELVPRLQQLSLDSSSQEELIDKSINDLSKDEYSKLYNYLIIDNDNYFEESMPREQISSSKSKIKHKRFLKSLFEHLFSKNKTKSKGKTDKHDHSDDFFNNNEHYYEETTSTSTLAYKTYFPPARTTYSYGPITPKAYEHNAASDDAFYKLKKHCTISYDELCSSKRREMYELVKKCQLHKHLAACSEVLSVYCYVYFTRDLMTCFGADYDQYVPGKKFTPSPAPLYTTTKYYLSSTPSTRRISINVITSSASTAKPKIITTTKSSTTTTTTTTSTTKSTTKPTQKVTTTSKAASNNDLVNPFEGTGPITIPNDSEKLKKIGSFCLKTKIKEPNCDKMLLLLKEKFKGCEKKPKTDYDCQTFKMNFCSAFTNFPCCPDVLAGRTCGGKSIRSDILM